MATAATSTAKKPLASRGGLARPMPLGAATNAASRSPRQTANAWACLLLAGDAERRRHFERAASAAGWDPIPCSTVAEATKNHQRRRTQLAAVDLASMNEADKATFLQFAERMSSAERLLVISDESDDGLGEIQARQAGAWVYLPSPEFGAGLIQLFTDARSAAEKLAGAPVESKDDANTKPTPNATT